MSIAENTQNYRQTVRELSERLVEAQRPIRILDAIKWDGSVQQAFFAKGCRELPPVDRRYYEERALPFDPVAKRQELHDIERALLRKLGQFNPIGLIMRRMSREYRVVVRLLESRGLPEFASYSQQLYGSSGDVFHAGDPTLADLGDMMSEALTNISQCPVLNHEEKSISGEEAVTILQERLSAAYPDPKRPIRVMLSDNIVSDAAAGADYLKIRREARFTLRDLRLVEVHEGWVHLGTTLNGLAQPVCTFLSKGPPSATITQEGLAIVMEVLAFASHPNRLRRVTNRIRGVRMAEAGANFLEVFNFFRQQGEPDDEAYANTVRLFRGSTPTGGPFTKDLSYSKGFILVYNFLRLAVRKGRLERIPLLFCGKATLEDIGVLSQLADEGILSSPRYVPPPFADLNALCAWMCYSNFLNRLDLNRAEADFASLL